VLRAAQDRGDVITVTLTGAVDRLLHPFDRMLSQ
jgi:hypothetical protein